MEWGWTTEVVAWVIDSGYHIWRPYRWDPVTKTVIDVNTIWGNVRWILGVIVANGIRAALFVKAVHALYNNEVQLTKTVDILPIILLFSYIWSALFDFHTIYRRRELRTLLNVEMDYFKTFIQKYARMDIKQGRNWSPYLLGVTILSLLSMGFLTALVYLLNCELHAMYTLIPSICSKEKTFLFGVIPTKHYSLIVVAVMTPVQALFCLHNVSTAFVYLTIGYPFAFIGINIFRELGPANDKEPHRTYDVLRTQENWTLHYRIWNLFVNLTDRCLFDFVIPSLLAIIMVLSIGILFMLIKIPVGPILFLWVGSFQVVLFAVLFCIFDRLSNYEIISASILKYWGKEALTEELRAQHRSMSQVRLKIGPFCYLEKNTVILMMEIIVGHTVDLLILSASSG